jgi:hypothetical protein
VCKSSLYTNIVFIELCRFNNVADKVQTQLSAYAFRTLWESGSKKWKLKAEAFRILLMLSPSAFRLRFPLMLSAYAFLLRFPLTLSAYAFRGKRKRKSEVEAEAESISRKWKA